MKTWPRALGPIGRVQPKGMGYRLSDGEFISRRRSEYFSRTVQKPTRAVPYVLHVPGWSGVVHVEQIVVTAALAQSEMPSDHRKRDEVKTSDTHEDCRRPQRHRQGAAPVRHHRQAADQQQNPDRQHWGLRQI